MKEMLVQSLIWEHPTCLGATGSERHNYCLWSRARALQQEKPLQWEAGAPHLESSPRLLQLEKNPHTETKSTEDYTVGCHHQLDWHEFEKAPGVGNGQGILVCCSTWGCKSQTWLHDWTELNWTESGGEHWKVRITTTSDIVFPTSKVEISKCIQRVHRKSGRSYRRVQSC